MADWMARLEKSGALVEAALYNEIGGTGLYPQFETVTEELTADGVAGVRKREVNADGLPPPISLRLYLPLPAGVPANYWDKMLGSMRGAIIKVTLKTKPAGDILDGFNQAQFHLDSWAPIMRTGPLVGFGSVTGSGGTIVATVTLKWIGQ